METIYLKRFETNAFETLGNLFYKDEKIAATLELPWRNNMPRVSCIPKGEYKVIRRHTAKYGKHFHITGVQGRSYILIHTANYFYNLLGCIGVGREHVHINADNIKDINYSRATMKKLLELLPNEFILKIM